MKFKARYTAFIIALLTSTSGYSEEYTIQVGAYRYAAYAQKAHRTLECNATIHEIANLYKLQCGSYPTKAQAYRAARRLRPHHPDLFVTPLPTKRDSVPQGVSEDPFALGMRFFQEGLYEQALAQFERILILSPNNQRVRLEYARTLFRLHLYTESKRQFERILHTNPPARVKAHIDRYLSMIDAKSRTHHLFGSLTLGYSHDDNIAYKSDTPYTHYGPLTLINDTNATSASYGRIELALADLYQTPSYDITTTLFLYSELFHDAPEYKTQFVHLSSTLQKTLGSWSISLPVEISRTWLGGAAQNDTYTLSPSLSKRIHPKMDLTLGAEATYLHDLIDAERSFGMYGIRSALSYHHTDRRATITYAHRDYDKRHGTRLDISRRSDELSLIGSLRLIEHTWLKLYIDYERRTYTEADPLLGDARKDTKREMELTLSRGITKKSSIDLAYDHIRNSSNIGAYSYKKCLYRLDLNHDF